MNVCGNRLSVGGRAPPSPFEPDGRGDTFECESVVAPCMMAIMMEGGSDKSELARDIAFAAVMNWPHLYRPS